MASGIASNFQYDHGGPPPRIYTFWDEHGDELGGDYSLSADMDDDHAVSYVRFDERDLAAVRGAARAIDYETGAAAAAPLYSLADRMEGKYPR